MKTSVWEINWKLAVLLLLMLILAQLIDIEQACSAESAVVSFNDAEQLAAISDSIVGVCDTVEEEWTHYEYGYWRDWDGDGVKTFIPCDTSETYITYPITRAVITCRELVCRTVVKFPIKLRYFRDTLDYCNFGLTVDDRWWEDNTEVCLVGNEEYTVKETIPGTAIITWRKVKR